jgi:hypothetical protein
MMLGGQAGKRGEVGIVHGWKATDGRPWEMETGQRKWQVIVPCAALVLTLAPLRHAHNDRSLQAIRETLTLPHRLIESLQAHNSLAPKGLAGLSDNRKQLIDRRLSLRESRLCFGPTLLSTADSCHEMSAL